MAKTITDTRIKNLKYSKQKSLSLGDRLSIKIDKNNNKSFKYEYMRNGKRTVIGLGGYPDISLKVARAEAFKLNQWLAIGKDPKIEREKQKLRNNNSFVNVSEQAFTSKNHNRSNGWAEDNYKRNYSILHRLVLPRLNNINIQDIEPWQIAKILEGNTPSNQEKIKNILNMIFGFAVGKGLIKYNIAREIKAESRNTKGFGFIDPIEQQVKFSKLLNDIEEYKGSYNIKKALKLAVLLGFRPQNIVSLKWEQISDIRVDNQIIHIITVDEEYMKMGRKFKQPLSKQAYNLLMEIKNVNGGYKYVFPSHTKSKHISKDSLSKALRVDLGYNGIDNPQQHTHGFRKSVRTFISSKQSKYKWDKDAIKMVLSHLKGDSIDNIYDKYEYIPERLQMLQLWADYIDHVKENANVIRLEDIG